MFQNLTDGATANISGKRWGATANISGKRWGATAKVLGKAKLLCACEASSARLPVSQLGQRAADGQQLRMPGHGWLQSQHREVSGPGLGSDRAHIPCQNTFYLLNVIFREPDRTGP